MTTIKAMCPHCGEVGLTPDEVELRVDHSGAGKSFYAFACPTCTHTVRKPADERVIRLLLSGGVTAVPGDQLAPEQRPSGPRFTYDDLLDFHMLLDGSAWFDALIAVDETETVG